MKLFDEVYYVGGCDRSQTLFENLYPIQGMTYNSYLVLDDKNVLLDTVDWSVGQDFLKKIQAILGEKSLDYVIVNHMEPDHAATLELVLKAYPKATLVATAKALAMVPQFFEGLDIRDRSMAVKEGDLLTTGSHTYQFILAPMVHWPEVMVTYETKTKALFSADAFGTFGDYSGSMLAKDYDFALDWLPEARRYYTNIVGKYGVQVNAVLKKAAALEISALCPLHGPIFTENLGQVLEIYGKWANYQPEEDGVLICYGSIYGHTKEVAERLSEELRKRQVKTCLYDVSTTDASWLVGKAFEYSKIVLASVTYNGALFPKMEYLANELKAHNLSGRTLAFMENGSWGPLSVKLLRGLFENTKNTILEEKVTIKSSFHRENQAELDALADALAE